MKKYDTLSLVLRIIAGSWAREEKKHAEKFIENDLENDYGEYLDKPQEHRDEVIKKMYHKTKYANEPPERLRKILYEQITGNKKTTH